MGRRLCFASFWVKHAISAISITFHELPYGNKIYIIAIINTSLYSVQMKSRKKSIFLNLNSSANKYYLFIK